MENGKFSRSLLSSNICECSRKNTQKVLAPDPVFDDPPLFLPDTFQTNESNQNENRREIDTWGDIQRRKGHWPHGPAMSPRLISSDHRPQ